MKTINITITSEQYKDILDKSRAVFARWHFTRWVYLFVSLLSAFIALSQNVLNIEFMHMPSYLFAACTGAIWGFLIKQWNGSREMKLLIEYSDVLKCGIQIAETMEVTNNQASNKPSNHTK